MITYSGIIVRNVKGNSNWDLAFVILSKIGQKTIPQIVLGQSNLAILPGDLFQPDDRKNRLELNNL